MNSNLAVKPYVLSGIEWDIDIEFHYGIENAKYIETLINDVKYLPIKNGNIPFADNRWDLRPYYLMRKSPDLVFGFVLIPDVYKNVAKFYVLLSLLNSDKKPTTINRRLQDIRAFLTYLESRNILSLENIFPSTIHEYMESNLNLSVQSRVMQYNALFDFFKFVNANYTYNLHFDLSIFDERLSLITIVKATKENNKIPDIPKEYFNKLISLLIKSIRNTALDYTYRAIACVYIILSQTGLRIGEVVSLECDSLKPVRLKNLDVTTSFITYKSFKPGDKVEDYMTAEIFANELTKEAFDTLVDLRSGRPDYKDNNFIYLPNARTFPATPTIANKFFHQFLAEFADYSKGDKSPYPELNVIKNLGRPIFAPTSKQFRVRLCTELYERNVPLLYIKKYMNHLSDEMIGYYSRPKKQKQEDTEYSNQLLKALVNQEISLLGNDANQIMANIDGFIKANKFNIEKDIDSIIDSLNGKFVIRAKQDGVCIKTSIRECARDARTNEMFCAYNICPNIFRLYYMADKSYDDFLLVQKTFIENDKNGFKLQSSKELNKLKDLCRRRLIPELDDLKQRILAKGIDEILERYPNLSHIILSFDEVMEEINKWMKMKY